MSHTKTQTNSAPLMSWMGEGSQPDALRKTEEGSEVLLISTIAKVATDCVTEPSEKQGPANSGEDGPANHHLTESPAGGDGEMG